MLGKEAVDSRGQTSSGDPHTASLGPLTGPTVSRATPQSPRHRLGTCP